MNHRQGGALKFPGEVLCTRSLEEAVLREEVPESSRVSVVQQAAPSLLNKERKKGGSSLLSDHAFALLHQPGADFNVLTLGLWCMKLCMRIVH